MLELMQGEMRIAEIEQHVVMIGLALEHGTVGSDGAGQVAKLLQSQGEIEIGGKYFGVERYRPPECHRRRLA